jgi:hypothetical protein
MVYPPGTTGREERATEGGEAGAQAKREEADEPRVDAERLAPVPRS